MQSRADTAVPAYAFDAAGRMIVARCGTCGQITAPPRPYHCSVPTDAAVVDALGRVESWTVIRVAPDRFPVPYVMAYVLLDAGPRVLARIAGWDEGASPGGRRVALEPDSGGPGPRLKARLI